MEQTLYRILWVFYVLSITSCASAPSLRDVSLQHELQWHPIDVDGFILQTISRPIASPIEALHIYIGGDGVPWQNQNPAADPTGSGNLTINLLLADPTPALYITRPCYQLEKMPPECHPDLWTSARYSDQITNAMADAITQVADSLKPASLTLIGYSGGGVLALLTAAQLDPQPRVITVASNLDTDAWTKFHGHLPLSQSSNPLLKLNKDNGSEHIHLMGGRDRVVPPSTISRYQAAHPLATYRYFEDFDHRCCWVKHWSDILKTITPSVM